MAESSSEAGVGTPPANVLVATSDDTAVDADSIGDRLRGRAGNHVETTATTPGELLDVLRRTETNCLVVPADRLDEPLVDCLSAVRDIDPEIPVILYGDGERPVDPAAVAAGIDDYVVVGEDDVHEAIATAVLDAVDDAPSARGGLDALHGALIENSSDVLAILTRDGTFEYVSPAIERVVGWTPADLEGEVATDFVHPDDHEMVVEEFFEDPAEWIGQQREATFRFRTPDDEYRIIESTARSLLDDPRIEGVVMNSRDVTECEQRREELELYETIVETVPVGLFVVDEASNVEWLNREAVDIVEDMTEAELLDTRVLDMIREGYFDHEMAEKYVDGVRDMLSSDTEADRLIEDVAYHPPDGSDDRYFNVHWALRPFEDGEFQGTVVVFQEITERKEFEEQLKAKNERLEQFASFVSHDLRNPLNVAQGFAQQAKTTGDPGAIEEVEVSLNRMEQLIAELLTMAREGNEIEEIVEVDLGDMAETAWRTVDTKAATLTTVEDAVLSADEGLLRQVLENLFRNSVEHASEDVAVTVGLLDGERGFYVEDDGPGIPADRREEVLEMGYTTSQEGTGFGLGIVTQIADAHDWQVDVTDGEDGGARFEFTGVDVES